MATLNQQNASRNNGARSKGPVTAEGKAKSAQNGLTHGLYSRQTVLRNENAAEYAEWREAYLSDYRPTTKMETDLVLDIVDARWRLRRFRSLETAAIDFEVDRSRPQLDEIFKSIDEETRTVLGFNTLITSNMTFQVLQTCIRTRHRIIDRSTNQLLRLRRIRPDDGSGGVDHTDAPNRGCGVTSESAHAAYPAEHVVPPAAQLSSIRPVDELGTAGPSDRDQAANSAGSDRQRNNKGNEPGKLTSEQARAWFQNLLAEIRSHSSAPNEPENSGTEPDNSFTRRETPSPEVDDRPDFERFWGPRVKAPAA